MAKSTEVRHERLRTAFGVVVELVADAVGEEGGLAPFFARGDDPSASGYGDCSDEEAEPAVGRPHPVTLSPPPRQSRFS